jgi:hypothetical protein
MNVQYERPGESEHRHTSLERGGGDDFPTEVSNMVLPYLGRSPIWLDILVFLVVSLATKKRVAPIQEYALLADQLVSYFHVGWEPW